MPKALPLYLTPSRRKTSSIPDRSEALEVLSDTARIITSSSFRRLQTKAQVFSLEENSAVRSRLTHTLEVAVYGELIATKVAAHLVANHLLSDVAAQPFVHTVKNACYLHDIGNPPFGHLGEYAVQHWFRINLARIKDTWIRQGVPTAAVAPHLGSFEHFDGNSQGLRTIMRLQWLDSPFGLNLTRPLIASVVKYLAPVPGSTPHFGKKAGFFESERDDIVDVWKQLGLAVTNNLPRFRHPLTFLMEAADDIAYCVSDIEDALEKGIVSDKDLEEHLPRRVSQYVQLAQNGRCKHADFLNYRINFTRALVDQAADTFIAHYDSILNGGFNSPLLSINNEVHNDLDDLRTFTRNRIFASDEAVTIELSGHRIITVLLDHLSTLLELCREAFWATRERRAGNVLALEQRLASRLPRKHWLSYEHSALAQPDLEPVFRTHLIVDYVAGMTDRHAVKVFRMLEGDLAGDLA